MLRILQWNMGGTPHAQQPKPHPNPAGCAGALTELLIEYEPAIVALQESTDELLTLVKMPAYDIQRGPLGLTTLVRRQHYRAVSNRDIRQRIQLVQLDEVAPGRNDLVVFNVHFPILYKDESERRDANLLFARDVANEMIASASRWEIIVGDFNTPPYDSCMVGKAGFYANRNLDYAHSSHSTVERALYNASWSIFGGATGAPGTLYHRSATHGPWQVPDQMLLHPQLVKGYRTQVQIITKLTHKPTHKMGTSGGRPSKIYASDHFPVLVTIS